MYPYDSLNKFNERKLPNKEDFYSILNDEHILDKDYQHAKNVWYTLKLETSYIANRYGKANNKYMKIYNEKAPSKYIMYLDANHLYGYAMSQYLPTGNFKWLTKKQIKKLDLAKYKKDSRKGLILEVDLDYPKELHNLKK